MMECKFDESLISKCRICFEEKDDMHSVFKKQKGTSVFDKLLDYTKLRIQKDDGGPSLICVQCVTELEITVTFLNKCDKSNDTLTSFINNSNIRESYDEYQNIAYSNKDWVEFNILIDSGKSDMLKNDKCNENHTCLGVTEVDNKSTKKCVCHFCGKRFKRKNNLKVHNGVRRYSCKRCSSRRVTHGVAMAHEPPSSAPPHVCPRPACRKRFTARANLLIHLRSHTGERPHECEECHKRFISKSTLRVHQRIHSGVKPYMCAECGARFTSNKLAAHMRRHRAPRAPRPPRAPSVPAPAPVPPPAPLACPRAGCRRQYRHKQSLNKHLRKHHKNDVPLPLQAS